MIKINSLLFYLKSAILVLLVFLFPLFLLSLTQEFFITNKLYLLFFAVLFLFLISLFQFLISKKISWVSSPFDNFIILFVLTVGLSILISSPNKIQAIINPNFGLTTFLSLTVLYFYLSRSSSTIQLLNYSITFSSIILSVITVIFFFQPFKNIAFPQNLQFLSNSTFTPIGNQLDLAIFLGFFVVFGLAKILQESTHQQSNNRSIKQTIFYFLILVLNFLAFSLTLYSLLKPQTNNQLPIISYQLPPFSLSWYAAVETLKNPITALFGVGVDNFSSIFTRVKDIAYNQSPLWQIYSFPVSRSTALHIFTEAGVFGLTAFLLLLFSIVKNAFLAKDKNPYQLLVIGYLLLIMLFFPPSLIVFFLFFSILATIANYQLLITNNSNKSFDFSGLLPFYLGLTVVSLILISTVGYLLGRSYTSEYYFKQSLNGFPKNDIKQVYDNMRQAIILNPYIERFHLNFSQVNLNIANNIANKTNQPKTDNQQPAQLSDQDRQNIAQAIQIAIAEAKTTVSLNPQKAANWENLALIYRNILNVTQGADAWTISAYQRAIVADPQNPHYRLNLGGVYYSLNNWDEASNLFNQTINLKPNWPNAYYNLAWALYQKNNYEQAVNAMQNVLTLLHPEKDKADYEKAQKDLEEFKKKLPKTEEKTSNEIETKQNQLSLPTPQPTLSPKIELPKEASPEAK